MPIAAVCKPRRGSAGPYACGAAAASGNARTTNRSFELRNSSRRSFNTMLCGLFFAVVVVQALMQALSCSPGEITVGAGAWAAEVHVVESVDPVPALHDEVAAVLVLAAMHNNGVHDAAAYNNRGGPLYNTDDFGPDLEFYGRDDVIHRRQTSPSPAGADVSASGVGTLSPATTAQVQAAVAKTSNSAKVSAATLATFRRRMCVCGWAD